MNSSDFQDFPDGGIVRGVAGGEFGVIFQDGVIRRMVYAVGASYVFRSTASPRTKACSLPIRSFAPGTRFSFWPLRAFTACSSTGVPEPIGKEKFDRAFFGDYDPAQLQLIIGAADPENSRVLGLQIDGRSSGLFDKLICYDYGLNRASVISLPANLSRRLSSPGLTLEGSTRSRPISRPDVLVRRCRAVRAAENRDLRRQSQARLCTGANVEATLDTAEQALDERRVRVKGLRPITDAATATARSARARTRRAP